MSDSDSNIMNIASVVTYIVMLSCFLCVIGLIYAVIKKNGNGYVLMSISVLILFITCMLEQVLSGQSGLANGIIDIMSNN